MCVSGFVSSVSIWRFTHRTRILSLAIILVIVYVIPMNVFSENLTYYIKVYIIQINLAKRFVVENWFSWKLSSVQVCFFLSSSLFEIWRFTIMLHYFFNFQKQLLRSVL